MTFSKGEGPFYSDSLRKVVHITLRLAQRYFFILERSPQTFTFLLNNKNHFLTERNDNRFIEKNLFSLYYNIKQIKHQHNPGDTRKGSSKKLTLLFINLHGLVEGEEIANLL